MALLRRPGSIPQVDPTQGGKAGLKDPRRVLSGNNPFAQPDIAQFAQLREQLAANPAKQYSLASPSAPDVTARTVPAKIDCIPWSVTTIAGFVPVLIVPRNLNRVSLILANDTAITIHASIGPPIIFGGTNPVGISLLSGTIYQFPGLTPINDIYVYATSAQPVVFYEGFEVTGLD